jgi:hypothetical protein
MAVLREAYGMIECMVRLSARLEVDESPKATLACCSQPQERCFAAVASHAFHHGVILPEQSRR